MRELPVTFLAERTHLCATEVLGEKKWGAMWEETTEAADIRAPESYQRALTRRASDSDQQEKYKHTYSRLRREGFITEHSDSIRDVTHLESSNAGGCLQCILQDAPAFVHHTLAASNAGAITGINILSCTSNPSFKLACQFPLIRFRNLNRPWSVNKSEVPRYSCHFGWEEGIQMGWGGI
jgi:hypothetical protein